MTPSFCFDAVMLRLAPNRPFFEGWGTNYIRPQTYFSDFRFVSKASFETKRRICLTTVRIGTSLSFLIYLQTREILIIINLLKFP